MKRLALGSCAVITALFVAPHARAGGYDTPMLYTARHMGMGGTAISYVNDPSAMFHNPAGLGHIERGAVIGDFSLLYGHITASPDLDVTLQPINLESEATVAPFFLVGGAYRLGRVVTLGVGVYPIASAGATFEYNGLEDTTRLIFIEASPGASFNIHETFRIGVGYRVTYAQLERFKGNPNNGTPFIDFDLNGTNFLGFRVGAQWNPTSFLEFGAVYRSKTVTEVSADKGIALRETFSDVSNELVLPTKMGVGARANLHEFGPHLGIAVDMEYGLNSENEGAPLKGRRADGTDVSVANVFEWSNSITLRTGLEAGLLQNRAYGEDQLKLRVGYIYDAKTTNERYPTPFGTPPAATQVLTFGSGWDGGPWEVNLAYAYRFGSTDISAQNVNAFDPSRKPCQFCGFQGNYEMRIHGFYVDASYAF